MVKLLAAIILVLVLGISQSHNTPRIAVMSAFAGEYELILDRAEIERVDEVLGRTVHVGTLEGQDVIIGLTGVGMENAAMTAQAWLLLYNLELIVFSGIAGGVDPELNVGDVTILHQWALYEYTRASREIDRERGFPVFDTDRNYLTQFGMSLIRPLRVANPQGEVDSQVEKFWFEASNEYVDLAREVLDEVELVSCTGDNVCVDDQPRIVVGGSGVSANTFVDNAEYREFVYREISNVAAEGETPSPVRALDMETAAVALVAYVNDVPYLAIRTLSDLAGGEEGENVIALFRGVAAENSALVLFTLLGGMR